jgi:RHS repeat-associated protein
MVCPDLLDYETGNYYYRARYYSTKLGRFMQTDPLRQLPGLNLYTYVGNNPVGRMDPMGENMYGHYCGPGEDPGSPTAIDPLDEACKQHDKCYDRCVPSGTFCLPPSECHKVCDKQLCNAARDARCTSPTCMIAKPIIQIIYCSSGYLWRAKN